MSGKITESKGTANDSTFLSSDLLIIWMMKLPVEHVTCGVLQMFHGREGVQVTSLSSHVQFLIACKGQLVEKTLSSIQR